MRMKGQSNNQQLQEVAEFIKSSILPLKKDIYDEDDWKKLALEFNYDRGQDYDGGTITLVVKPGKDSRRSCNPLELTPKTTKCFCDFIKFQSFDVKSLSSSSNVFINSEKTKACMASKLCGPEPTVEHFIDLYRLASALANSPIIIAINLHGSGASVPQHFHTQICPKGESLTRLLANFRCSQKSIFPDQACLEVKEIVQPMWGIEIKFGKGYLPENIGGLLFKAIHSLRYRSQLKLSYNLYVDSQKPDLVRIIFRESRKECPFGIYEGFSMLTKRTNKVTARQIVNLDSARWRWGWAECIGELPARDDIFADANELDSEFWKEVYEFMSLDKTYRASIRNNVINILREGVL